MMHLHGASIPMMDGSFVRGHSSEHGLRPAYAVTPNHGSVVNFLFFIVLKFCA